MLFPFSYMPDYLPMWYMYANRGEGVCMGFEMEELKNIWPVIYDLDKIEGKPSVNPVP